MAEKNEASPGEQAQSAGIVFAIISGLAGYLSNELGGAVMGAIAGYAAGRVFVYIFHTAKQFIVSGIILFVLVMLFTGYLGRIGNAVVPKEEAPKADGEFVWVHNACHREARLFLKWKQPGAGWTVNGPWRFAPEEKRLLEVGDETIRAASPEIYLYAYSPGGKGEWKGSYNVDFKEFTLPMVQAVVTKTSTYDIKLTCERP